MSVSDIDELNSALDYIIESRRSIRSFKEDVPPKEQIKQIIHAGLLAPYAALAIDDKDYFRRFVVVEKNSTTMKNIAEIVRQRTKTMAKKMRGEMQNNPFLREKGERFVKRLELFGNKGVPGIGAAPYFIVVAERKGFPPVEQQSLAHCLQNMWLKGTALGLGLQLLSVTAQMADDEEFCKVLGIPYGEFGLNGCSIGYPQVKPAEKSVPQVGKVTKWFD